MKVAILTSPQQWFEPYAETLSQRLGNASLYNDHDLINDEYDVLFILSYHRKVGCDTLNKNKHNIVIHESDLPQGKGWAPLFWQVLEGKSEIVFSMLEADEDVDSGDIHMQKTLYLTGYELNEELRQKQAELSIDMCVDFLKTYDKAAHPRKQSGEPSCYRKRGPGDSELDIYKSIKDQFNLLRIVNNEEYPAFFSIEGKKFLLKIEQMEDSQ